MTIKKKSYAVMLNILGNAIVKYRKKEYSKNDFFFDYLKTNIRAKRKMRHLTKLKK